MYITLLHCTILYCTVLYWYYIVHYCAVLYFTVPYCSLLFCNGLFITVLYKTLLSCNVLHWSALQFPLLVLVLCYTERQCSVLICTTLGPYLEKPRGYHGEWSALGGPKAKTRGTADPEGFWPRDLPRHSIHHDTPKAFPYNVIISASWTRK